MLVAPKIGWGLWLSSGVAWWQLADYLFAQGDPGAVGAPTTIVGAFILLSSLLMALVGWGFKRQYDETAAVRMAAAAAATEMRSFYEAQAERLRVLIDRYHELTMTTIAAFREETTRAKEHALREREQFALLADERRRRALEGLSGGHGHHESPDR